MADERDGAALPLVSVVIPVLNEGRFIARALGSVLRQDYPTDRMEVFVVDGMSEDDTVEQARRVTADAQSPPKVIFLRNPQRVVPAALNQAISEAKGDVIVRVDGHCEVAPDYVRRCVEILDETRADNVGGVQRPVAETPMGRAVALATTSRYGIGNARFRYSTQRESVDTVYLGAYRRDVFDRLGSFDEELANNQDDEFNLRLIRAGGRILLDPTIRVWYRPRESLSGLGRQYFRYGLYKIRVMQKARGFTAARHYVPAAFVVALLAGAGVAVATRTPWIALVLPGVYTATCVMAASVVGRRDPQTIPRLPVVFATLHLAYGIGSLWGIWRWRSSFGR